MMMTRSPRHKSVCALCAVFLIAWAAGAHSAEAVDPWEQFVSVTCGYKELPKPGSLAGFMGDMQRANTTRTSFAYYRFGGKDSELPPLVLIDGLGDSVTYWPPELLQELSEKQEVVVFDNPGQGFSERLDGEPLSIEGMADDYIEFFDILGLDRPNVWGYSMGAMIASAMAANNGDKIGKVLAAVGSPGSKAGVPFAPDFLAALQAGTLGNYDWGEASYNLNSTKGIEAACWKLYQMAGALQHPFDADTFMEQLDAILKWFDGPGVYDRLGEVANPMLFVGGQLDYIIPPENQRLFASRVPQSWLVMYPDALHDVMIQERSSLLPIMYSFFENA